MVVPEQAAGGSEAPDELQGNEPAPLAEANAEAIVEANEEAKVPSVTTSAAESTTESTTEAATEAATAATTEARAQGANAHSFTGSEWYRRLVASDLLAHGGAQVRSRKRAVMFFGWVFS